MQQQSDVDCAVSASPLPWHVGPHYKSDVHSRDGDVCACVGLNTPRAIANAAFIVRAANCHDELLAVLKAIEEIGEIDGHGHRYRGFDYFSPIGKQLRAAIKKAEGTP